MLLSAKDRNIMVDICEIVIIFGKGAFEHYRCHQGTKGDRIKVRGNIMETESKSRITELPMETQEILKNIAYPVNRSDIIGQARKSGAIPDIMRGFGMLPDRQYNSAADVAMELHIIYLGPPA